MHLNNSDGDTCDWKCIGHLLELRVMMKYNESKVIIYQGNGHKG